MVGDQRGEGERGSTVGAGRRGLQLPSCHTCGCKLKLTEPCSSCILLQVGETYNIGTQKERSVVDVARDICKLFNRNPETTVKHVRDRAFNDRRYFM